PLPVTGGAVGAFTRTTWRDARLDMSSRGGSMKWFSTCLLILVFLVLSHAPVTAQELTTGTITGQVTDLAARPIAGAVVIVVSESGTRTAASDANGRYIVPFLRPGTYTVRVEAAAGFTT